jgi:hypothetical protein
MRVVLERVTCDRCGQVFDFEKLNDATNVARIEGLSNWLITLGWSMSDGLKLCDLCPNCKGT